MVRAMLAERLAEALLLVRLDPGFQNRASQGDLEYIRSTSSHQPSSLIELAPLVVALVDRMLVDPEPVGTTSADLHRLNLLSAG